MLSIPYCKKCTTATPEKETFASLMKDRAWHPILSEDGRCPKCHQFSK